MRGANVMTPFLNDSRSAPSGARMEFVRHEGNPARLCRAGDLDHVLVCDQRRVCAERRAGDRIKQVERHFDDLIARGDLQVFE